MPLERKKDKSKMWKLFSKHITDKYLGPWIHKEFLHSLRKTQKSSQMLEMNIQRPKSVEVY